ncbi:hypothetical protein ACFOWA_07780 [Pedobacter lithocola]|uniref:Lipoprotein n=1 Tax=Pedobacter lithocola TaxID=1908239 RepID=A0ABV8P8V7_9SPHI
MKRLYYLFIALLIMTSGCKKKSFEAITETRDFSINTPQNIGSSVFTVTSIEDNRCPINAFCVVAGKAVVSMTVKSGLQTKYISLCIGFDCKTAGISDNAKFKLGDVNHTIKFIDVIPNNNLTNANAPKTVKLEIIRN